MVWSGPTTRTDLLIASRTRMVHHPSITDGTDILPPAQPVLKTSGPDLSHSLATMRTLITRPGRYPASSRNLGGIHHERRRTVPTDGGGLPRHEPRRRPRVGDLRPAGRRPDRPGRPPPRPGAVGAHHREPRRRRGNQIGRASCRERV